MTSKEKAEELILKYLRIDNNTSEWFNTHIAKQCALIAVTEIINSNPHSNLFNFYSDIHSTMQYWNEVKNELTNL
jgi:hypothetical protein